MSIWQLADRVYETSFTQGIGAYDLAGAVPGFRTFAAAFPGGASFVPYLVQQGDDGADGWEVGYGTYTSGTDSLSRTAILKSTAGGAAVNWGAGVRTVALVMPAAWLTELATLRDIVKTYTDKVAINHTGTPSAPLEVVRAAAAEVALGVLSLAADGVQLQLKNTVTDLRLRLTATGVFEFINVTAGSTKPFTIDPASPSALLTIAAAGVGVGTAGPHASALLDVSSTTKGFLLPRMTTAQRDAIASPANGLIIYNSTTGKVEARAAGAWVALH